MNQDRRQDPSQGLNEARALPTPQPTPPGSGGYTPMQLYRRLLAYSLACWPLFALSLCALLVAAATEPLFAALMKPLIDENFSAQRGPWAQWLPLLIVLLFFVRGVASYVNEYSSAKLSGLVVQRLRADMLQRVLHAPAAHFVQEPSGKVISTLATNVEQVTEAGFNIITVAIRDGAVVLGLLAMLLYTNWQLTLVCLVIIPAIALGVGVAAKRLNRFAHRVQASHADLVQSVTEIINAQKIIKIFGAQAIETERFMGSAQDICQSRVKLIATSAANSALVQWLLALAVALVVYLAGHWGEQQRMTAGDFAAFMTAMMMLLTPVKRLTGIQQQLQKGLAAADNVFRLIDISTEASPGQHQVPRAQGRLRFKGVSLCYPGAAKLTLQDINLAINPGQTVGIVGASGSGKSSLINLVPRFFDPSAGMVYLDDVPLQDWDLHNLRKHIAVVTQESHLLHDTVRNNIAYGELRNAPLEAVVEAARSANALQFIEALDQGFDTVLGDHGQRLSGGQRQRIAMARAFLKNAPILILDEATSALDSQTERDVQADMERLRQGRTTLIVAHRLSTLTNADTIVVLDAGNVVEQGSHAELLQANGLYAQLYALQIQSSVGGGGHV